MILDNIPRGGWGMRAARIRRRFILRNTSWRPWRDKANSSACIPFFWIQLHDLLEDQLAVILNMIEVQNS